ncbi:hypothetical protein K2173_021298 [Erythroxylum novogranatense]|uniref:RRM domain-containing protein n=1 Tax=Erythroxylum novogranatense TaxID=1862640 RepID=A0AAV8TUL6_9ROSI|nr:hypothetical protein K2173_021298 [Erythroxylum novogranatense]
MDQVQVQKQTPVATPNGVAASGVSPLSSTALYVGGLEANVTDTQLYDLFNQLGQVVSVRVCRDLSTGQSLGYGYVNYSITHYGMVAFPIVVLTPVVAIETSKTIEEQGCRHSFCKCILQLALVCLSILLVLQALDNNSSMAVALLLPFIPSLGWISAAISCWNESNPFCSNGATTSEHPAFRRQTIYWRTKRNRLNNPSQWFTNRFFLGYVATDFLLVTTYLMLQ